MKKGFPNKILGLIPYGWDSLGEVGYSYVSDGLIQYTCHRLCRTRAKVARENNEIFLYCPKCMISLSITPASQDKE
jgi:hypothetical protein